MKKILCGAAALAIILSGCATTQSPAKRTQNTDSLAAEAGFTRRSIPAGGFSLAVFSRVSDPAQNLRVYIEGDGLAWIGRYRPSADPTPTDAIALRLAMADSGPNVVYMARPCQFQMSAACRRDYWTGQRFAPEIIGSMNSGLDEILRWHGFNDGTKIELVGFSGGGAVAALLAARRGDIANIRTVAGNLDHHAHSALHKVTPLSGSLNPPDYAARLRTIPQIHFIGGNDRNVQIGIYESYARALRQAPQANAAPDGKTCWQHHIVSGASHESGWVETWPRLLAMNTSDC